MTTPKSEFANCEDLAAERRQSERIALEGLEVTVRFDGKTILATVLDVSSEGVGLLFAESPCFEVSQRVETDHQGNLASALVQQIELQDDGTYTIGLEYLQ